MLVKMAEWQLQEFAPPQVRYPCQTKTKTNLKKEQKLSELTLENSQRFIVTKQALNQESVDLKILGKLCSIFTFVSVLLPGSVAILKTPACVGPGPLVLEGAEKTMLLKN